MGNEVKLNVDLIISLVNKLFISILVTFVLSITTLFLSPYKKEKNLEQKIIMPKDIGKELIKSRNGTERWWYNGSTARYTRNVTIPYFLEWCRDNKKSVEVNIQIIDPKNDKICKLYSDYRRGLDFPKKIKNVNNMDITDVKWVKYELLATIICCYIWKKEQPLLIINIGLKNYYSIFRVDLSTHSVIITKEDPKEVALFYTKGSSFYDAYYQDFIQTFEQSEKLNIDMNFYSENDVTSENIKELLSKLKLDQNFTNEDYNNILKIIKNKRNPYE
jgi:hypothetical protein